MNTVNDLLSVAQQIGSIVESNNHFSEGLAMRIDETGKPLNDFTIAELIVLIEQYREFYNNSLPEEQDDIERIINFEPCFSDEVMQQIELSSNDESRGLQRRLSLTACAKSADVLSNLSMSEPEAYTEMLEAIEEFKNHVDDLSEIAKAACFRMKITDCGEYKVEDKQ